MFYLKAPNKVMIILKVLLNTIFLTGILFALLE